MRLAHSLRQFARRPPLPFKIACLIIVAACYGTAGYLYFERPDRPGISWADGLWWSVVTMTTVGYGDHFPITMAGRFLIAYPIMLVGMGFMALGLTTLASFFIRAESLNRRGHMMTKHHKHIIVCNYPSQEHFHRMLDELRAQHAFQNTHVILIDEKLTELDTDLAARKVTFVRGNPAQATILKQAGIEHAARAIVLAKNTHDAASDNATVAVCLALKHSRPDMHVVAECIEPSNQEVIKRSGCDGIVCVMSLAPGILVQEAGDAGIIDVLREMTIWNDQVTNIFIVPVDLPPAKQGTDSARVNQLRQWSSANDATLLGLRSGTKIELNPHGERPIEVNDAAIILSTSRPSRIALA